MKKLYLFATAMLLSFVGNAQTIEIKDPALLYYLTQTNCVELYSKPGVFGSIDTNRDGQIQESEALDVKSIDLSRGRDNIAQNTGMPQQYSIPSDIGPRLSFPGYDYSRVYTDQEVQSLVDSGAIQFFDTYTPQPINLITDFTAINSFLNIESINICFAAPSNFNFKNLKKLKTVKNVLYQEASNPYISTSQGNFVSLYFQGAEPYSVGAFARDLNYPIMYYNVAVINQLTFDNCPLVEYININEQYQFNGVATEYTHPITTLDVSALPLLNQLTCSQSNISSLNLSNNTLLTHLNCYSAKLELLDLSNNKKLINVNCEVNAITSLKLPTTETLLELSCSSNKLTTLDVTNNTKLTKLKCNFNELTSVSMSKNQALIDFGAQYNKLSSIDISSATALQKFNVGNNKLTAIDVSKNLLLKELYLMVNELTDIDVSKNVLLQTLEINNNQLTKINTTQNRDLTSINLSVNSLTTLDLTNNLNLYILNCVNNTLTSLDVTKNTRLNTLNCQNNQLKVLDLSKNKSLSAYMNLSSNNLEQLNIKNGANSVPTFDKNPTLKYICADDNELAAVQTKMNQYGYKNVAVNSYCSFVPGGDFYTIKGKNQDCKNNTVVIPNLRYTIKSGNKVGVILSNEKGEYTVPVQIGSHTLTPQLENANYYTVTPESILIKVTSETNTTIQDFCITPKSNINDLEVAIQSGDPARPGFDVNYKIVYKNKGTTTLSGSVDLQYQDDVLDYLKSSVPNTSKSLNRLMFEYKDLKPFEKRTIEVSFNVNSPMETPAVNGNDILVYTATITSDKTDETPKDNEHTLRQTVVNSFDPNDKTCLEGDTILPEMIGEYVHYKIRFENTGTFPAENIVVVDEIDTKKFDITTLVPLDASHKYETKISGNKVEFIFEKINLPFDDATNDGYVMFKIKTLPTLKLNDSFSNQASIYFDFNFPIVTNNATTTIENHLGAAEFAFNEQLTLYPNPVKDQLTIEPKNGTQVQSITIRNLQGQLIQSVPQVSKPSVDVSNLPQGMYLVYVKTDKGTTSTKVVKE